MSEKRFFGFVEFGAWVRSQVQTLTDYLNLKLGEVNTRMDGVDQTLQSKADQSALDSTNQAVATKLDANATAVDSSKLEGSTKAQVIGEARNGLATTAQVGAKLDATATAANSSKLEGSTKAQVVAEALSGLGTASTANIFVSTVDPVAADGKDGDLWIKYTP